MFIRKKKNVGGTTSIILLTSIREPGKKYSNLQIIKNFGASQDEQELQSLIKQAEEYKHYLLMTSPKAITLKITSAQDINSCTSCNIGFSDVYGKLFNAIFANISLRAHDIKKLQELVILRIAKPASKRKTSMIAHNYGISCGLDSIYKLMDKLTNNIISQTKKTIYEHTQSLLLAHREEVDVMFYDLTTVYFETNEQDELRNFGFSKDGKCQHVQIMLAVIVTKHGLPIDYEEFSGNCFEGHTLIPVIEKIKKRYTIDKVVLVADSALISKINLAVLAEKNINYVIAARIKNVKRDIKNEILEHDGYKKILATDDDLIKSKTITLSSGDFLVAFYSSKRAQKDEYDRQQDLEKIKKYLQSTTKSKLTSRLKKPYVKVSKGCKLEIDLEKLDNEKRFDGFFGLQTNLKNIDPKGILSTYRGLWQVEQTFRIAKSNLEIRPVFHYNPRRIRAHFLICYMSLALLRYVEFKLLKSDLHYTSEQLHFLLEQMRITKIHHSDNNIYKLLEDPPPDLAPIYQALNIEWRKKFSHEPIM